MRRLILLIGLWLVPPLAFAQVSATDSQNLKALLEEVRLLRHSMQTTMVAGQRVQIALYRLQLQDAALARANKAAEEAHSKLVESADRRKHVADELDRAEEQKSRTENAGERKAIEEAISHQLKGNLEQIAIDEQRWQAKANEADGQVTIEQGKLDALHALLDELDRALQKAGTTN
jgi:prophage DNA circulation protein